MPFILMWWKAIAGAGIAFLIAYALHHLDVARLELKHAAELSALQTTLIAQCNADKAITEGVSHDYQNSISALDSDLAGRVRVPSCVTIVAGEANGPHAAAGAVNDNPPRLPSPVLYQYAGQCEKYRLQVIGLQDFIDKTWKAKSSP